MKHELYLDGLWDFHFEEIPPQDYQIEKVKYETVMTVPGCFDTQPQYRFKRGVGFFRTKVNCGGKVKLEIGGLGLRARIYWDGRLVGSSELPYSKIELYFDAGAETIEHELVIAVDNRFDTALSSLFQPFYDFYGYGGVYGHVKISGLPVTYIEHFQVSSKDIATGTIRLKLELGGEIPRETVARIGFDDASPIDHVISGIRRFYI